MCGANPYAGLTGTHCVLGHLLWNVLSNGAIEAKLTWSGLLGWIAVGHENVGGDHNGMNGGKIVMALPASPVTYDAATVGLAIGASGPTVNEYIINEHGGSAFRLWNTPYAPSALTASGVSTTDCFTQMTFTTTSISGQPIADAAGNASLIFAFNGDNTYVGNHGRPSQGKGGRGKITVNWATSGLVSPPSSPVGVVSPFPAPPPSPAPPSSSSDSKVQMSRGVLAAILVGAVLGGCLVGGLIMLASKGCGTPSAAAPTKKDVEITKTSARTANDSEGI